MVRGANMVTDYGRIGKAKTTENRKSYVGTVYALRMYTNESPAPGIRDLRHHDAIRIVGR